MSLLYPNLCYSEACYIDVEVYPHYFSYCIMKVMLFTTILKLGVCYFLVDDMSLVVRKPVFGVSDLVRHKPCCTVTEDC